MYVSFFFGGRGDLVLVSMFLTCGIAKTQRFEGYVFLCAWNILLFLHNHAITIYWCMTLCDFATQRFEGKNDQK